MAKTPKQRLKVFQTQLGFYDTVVAAPSQPAALRLWGVHQNLFAGGQARIVDDPQTVAAALAHPEVPLRRAIGSEDSFALDAALPKVPEAPRKAPSPKVVAKPREAPPPRPVADRRPLDAAEARLREAEEDRKAEEARLQRLRDELDARRQAAQTAYVENHKAARAAVETAREAYRKAGGED